MQPDDPRHGTYAGYVAHQKQGEARCPACDDAGRRERKKWRLDTHRNGARTVPLGDAAWKLVATATLDQLARSSGVSKNTLARIRGIGDPEQMVRRRTRDLILAARTPTAIGAQRRLRALSALGWSMRAVGHEMGLDYSDNLRVLLAREEVDYVREPMLTAIVEVYGRLSMIRAPEHRGTSRARNRARANGWAPPLAWDDIDDPNEQPNIDGPTVTRPNGRPMKRDKVIENAEWMADADENLTVVCERLGLDPEALYQACRRGNRLDLYAKLSRRQPDGAGEQAVAMRGLRGAA